MAGTYQGVFDASDSDHDAADDLEANVAPRQGRAAGRRAGGDGVPRANVGQRLTASRVGHLRRIMRAITAMLVLTLCVIFVVWVPQLFVVDQPLVLTFFDLAQQLLYLASIAGIRWFLKRKIDAQLLLHTDMARTYLAHFVPPWWIGVLLLFTLCDTCTDVANLIKVALLGPKTSEAAMCWFVGAIFAIAIDVIIAILLLVLLGLTRRFEIAQPAF
jgi:hypothetical protein